MAHPFRSRRRLLPLAGLAVVALAGTAPAADTEVRQYATYVDREPAGSYTMTISRRDDGSTTMQGRANILVKFLAGLRVYRYDYAGTEVWKDGRLQQLESQTSDDGKQYRVSASKDGDHLSVSVNGQARSVPGDVWVTTYWRFPDRAVTPLALLDADTGRELHGSLQQVGPGKVQVAGKVVACTHYRLKHELTVDLWYDGQGRLLRQEWVEEGKRVVLELQSIR
jgi:hypothetical protein